jgi:ankyrin repeat protein
MRQRGFSKAMSALFAVVLLGAVNPAETPVADAPVADAAMRGNVEAVRSLLRSGADVNEAQGDGMTALHWAARLGDAELAQILIYAGSRLDAGTRIGSYTPLHVATREGKADVVEVLLEAGSDPQAVSTNSGTTPLHLAARAGDVRIVSKLIEHGADVDVTESAWGQTPLTFAAAMNRVDVIKVLLDAGADPNAASTVVDVVEMAAGDNAAEERLQKALESFKTQQGGGPTWQPTPSQVQAAIDLARQVQTRWPDIPQEDDVEEAEPPTPEEEAAEGEGATEGAKSAEGEDAPEGDGEETVTNEGGAAEAVAAEEGVVPAEVTESDEASADTESDDEGKEGEGEGEEEGTQLARPLSYAQQVGAWGGLAPLHHAVRQGHVEAALALLQGGADIDRSTGDHTTPLLMAAINGQWDLASILLEHSADPTIASVAGATPLYAVLERQWQPRASYAHPTAHQQQETSHLEMMELLLKAGADPDARLNRHLWYMEYTFGVLRGSGINLKGATPFWRAAYALDLGAMTMLTSWGADPDIRTMKPPQRRRRSAASEEDEEENGHEPTPAQTNEGEGTEAEPGEGEEALETGDSEGTEAGESEAAEVVQAADEPDAGTSEEDGISGDAVAEEEEGEEATPSEEEEEGEEGEEGTPSEEEEEEDEDKSGLPPVPADGPAIHAIHAASGVGYGQSFAGNAHRYVPNGWMPALRFVVEQMGADVNARDANGYTALHHAASRGDVEMIRYLVEHGADVMVVSRKGETVADMANGPVQRVRPYPEAVALLEELGSVNNHNCVSCE